MAEITIQDELRLLKVTAKRVRDEARMVVQGAARILDRVENEEQHVQSQEDTTDHGTDTSR